MAVSTKIDNRRILKTAELCGVGTGTVQRIKAEMDGGGPFAGDAAAA